ncbi:malonyl-ACP O-methyltransferase BioC [Anoxybacteroides tepidamans]|uniref:malonyl-ACP O-methyltransferase BioC n=1 Tax=Anoxybacteroides tepidamans TaxID=265948 RepID=UPI00047F9506|nr:malonyl-ACP O-methyltransferase BioC [Anoxybacillus tepidamans]
MIDKQLVRKRFSERAATYDRFANVQKKMADALVIRIAVRPTRILEVGCGTGYLTEQLIRTFPDAHLTAVDIAPGMIAAAQQRLDNRITWRCADIEEMAIDERYDLIISNATFQWLNAPERTINRLARALNPGGQLLFSTFGADTFQELHASFLAALKQHGIAERFSIGPSFPGLSDWLKRCEHAFPKAAVAAEETWETEYFPTVRDFFLSLRQIGATNSTDGRHCQRPSVFKTMMDEYERRFSKNGQIPATYHCLLLDVLV